MTIRTPALAPRTTTTPMAARTTAAPPDRRFRAALQDGASVLLGGVEAAARTLPGGPIVAAAIQGAGSLASTSASAGSGGASASAGALDPSGLMSSSDEAMQLIQLQQEIQEENRRYSTLSNVMKARHETAKNAIGNLR